MGQHLGSPLGFDDEREALDESFTHDGSQGIQGSQGRAFCGPRGGVHAGRGCSGAGNPPPTAQEISTSISSALSYTYNDAYQYTGSLLVDGSTVLAGYTVEQFNGVKVEDQGKAVTADMARFLGALKRYNQSPVTAIKFGSEKYVWDDNDALKGSNWIKGGDANKTTLVSQVVTALGADLAKNNAASVQLGISTDGTDYTNITLKAYVSTAKLTHEGKVQDQVYSLKSALDAAVSGDTVTMTSDAVTNEQLSLKAGVTLEGGNRTLIHLSNAANTAAGNGAAILHNPVAAGDAAVIKNLEIEGPNSTPATTGSNGTITRHWDSGEYAVKSYGEHANLVVQNIEVNRAQSALMATQGGKLTVKGSLKMSNLEYGGIEVSENANSELALDSTASISYSETTDTPFAWIHGNGKITNNTKLELAKVDKTANNESKAHYYLSSADSAGAHFYNDNDLTKSAIETNKEISLDGKKTYALLTFTPAIKGMYCFKSTGADAAAELYNINANKGLGAKIASGDNEQNKNFRIFANLEASTTYVLRVAISADAASAADHGNVTVSVAQTDSTKLDSYVLSLPSNTYYYKDKQITADMLNAAAKSAVDGKTLDLKSYSKEIHAVQSDGTIANNKTDVIEAAGKYVLKVTDASNENAGETLCYFDVLDNTKISDYRFTYNNTLVFASNQIASISSLAPKGYRYDDASKVCLDANNLSAEWIQVKDGAEVALSTAPAAVGNYIMRLTPNNAAVTGRPTNFATNGDGSTIDLKFSITRGKVAAPSARTGLTYTGSAQVGVPAGANYTLSGTASATNAGTYSCTATLAEGYSWTDGTTAPKTFTWSIAKAKIAVPSGNSGLTYNGKVQTGVTKSTSFTLTGTTTATEPGEYTCYATPASNYMWTDGTTATKTVKWTLGKADAAIVATPSTVVVESGDKATVALKQAGTAAYTVASADSKVATASVAGSSVSISAKGSGSTTVTVSTAATARYAASSTAITVCVPKDEDETGSAVTTVVGADGSITKVTNKFKVVTPYDASDSDVVPTVAFTGTSVKSGKVTVPSSVMLSDGITYKVTSIAPKAFKGAKITGVVIPKSVTKIGKDAFAGCKKLKTISFHNKVKSIGANVLKGSAAKSATLKSSKLSKTSIKNLVKGSKLTTVKCSGLSKKTKAKYAKWAKSYKKNVRFK